MEPLLLLALMFVCVGIGAIQVRVSAVGHLWHEGLRGEYRQAKASAGMLERIPFGEVFPGKNRSRKERCGEDEYDHEHLSRIRRNFLDVRSRGH